MQRATCVQTTTKGLIPPPKKDQLNESPTASGLGVGLLKLSIQTDDRSSTVKSAKIMMGIFSGSLPSTSVHRVAMSTAALLLALSTANLFQIGEF